jgi:protein-tyrosine phosphatase
MIDLHCHMLPGIDDGAPDLETALAMARMAVADGIHATACTPHIYPGVYENKGDDIRQAIKSLQDRLDDAGIALRLTCGADAHLAPELPAKLRSGDAPTLGGSRYFLLEPPHHVAPPRFADFVFNVVASGFVPVITHPERLTWIDDHYDTFCALVEQGAWMQITSGSVTGRFGDNARYWAERMLDEGRVHILATDAHGIRRRAPLLAEGRDAAAEIVGMDEAIHLVETRPLGILENLSPSAMPPLPQRDQDQRRRKKGGLLSRLFG